MLNRSGPDVEGQRRAADGEPAEHREADQRHETDGAQVQRGAAALLSRLAIRARRWPATTPAATSASQSAERVAGLRRREEEAALVEEADVADAEGLGAPAGAEDGEVDDEELDEQRGVAHQLDVAAGDAPAGASCAQARDAHEDAEDRGKHDPDDAHEQRVQQADEEGPRIGARGAVRDRATR